MELFLRNYYTNLNPNATEEEILAFLASQGFDVTGDFSDVTTQSVTGGIMNTPNMISGGGDGRINNINKVTGSGNINDLLDYIKGGGLIGATLRGAKNIFKDFADKRAGRLDITPDAAIMPGRPQGALITADDYGSGADGGGRSQSEQSFSESQSYGGGGSDDDMGADSFI